MIYIVSYVSSSSSSSSPPTSSSSSSTKQQRQQQRNPPQSSSSSLNLNHNDNNNNNHHQHQHQHYFPYSLGVRDSLMIAHSFHNHPSFGPAGGLHGATYTCDVEFLSTKLHPTTNWVIDIGKASEVVSKVLSKYNLQNLDDIFPSNILTTTEFMAKQIHDDIIQELQMECSSTTTTGDDEDDNDNDDFEGCIRVKLWESHKAWATYTGSSSSRSSS